MVASQTALVVHVLLLRQHFINAPVTDLSSYIIIFVLKSRSNHFYEKGFSKWSYTIRFFPFMRLMIISGSLRRSWAMSRLGMIRLASSTAISNES